jgi:hypothetical protein
MVGGGGGKSRGPKGFTRRPQENHGDNLKATRAAIAVDCDPFIMAGPEPAISVSVTQGASVYR